MPNKTYPLTLDSRVYEALKEIAKAQGKTMKEILRDSIGLYIAANISYLKITRRSDD